MPFSRVYATAIKHYWNKLFLKIIYSQNQEKSKVRRNQSKNRTGHMYHCCSWVTEQPKKTQNTQNFLKQKF